MEKFLEMMRNKELRSLQDADYWGNAASWCGNQRKHEAYKSNELLYKQQAADWRACREWCEGLQQQLAAAEKREAVLRRFCADIATNYDCDDDGHKYGTYCRKCDAQAALAEVENMKGEGISLASDIGHAEGQM